MTASEYAVQHYLYSSPERRAAIDLDALCALLDGEA
jgi:hypothetical protein